VETAGLPLATVAEAKGGAGADLGDAMAILREAGRAAVPVPLAETMLAAWMLAESGLEVPRGPLAIAAAPLSLTRAGSGWRVAGTAHGIAWARQCERLVVLARDAEGARIALVPLVQAAITRGANLAGEPRDTVRLADAVPERVAAAGAGVEAATLLRFGALARAAQMAGALEAVLELTVRYANERVQFGRPLARFQAIQQQVAVLATNVAAAGVACDAAIAAAAAGSGELAIAAAKARINEAATAAAAIAHQVHGAMGFTAEHPLHRFTTRLWAWREEFGDESFWWARLGATAAEAGADGLWPLLARAAGA
ncbi:MAG TPA: acyl-CoA dehydrogenase family protein, partial [Stellaceae bacterium]|nr:acyl-CoA dehydrogenase family protein [Stellaceae bacterium]